MLAFTVLRTSLIPSAANVNTSMHLSWIKTDHTAGKCSAYSTEAVRALTVAVPKFWLKKKIKKIQKKSQNA